MLKKKCILKKVDFVNLKIMNKDSKIFIAGHNGMVGSAILRKLKSIGFGNFVLRNSKELDLTNQAEVNLFFSNEKPEYVFLAAAKVGGIKANNTFRAEFIYENLMIQNNVIHAAFKNQTKKLLFLGSSCIYSKNAPQPLKEEYLLTGSLEQTNEPYAIAKIAGIKMCENYFHQYGSNFISVMPTNLYGPNDNYDLKNSHVLPALIRKIYLAKLLETQNWKAIKDDLIKNSHEFLNGENLVAEILNYLSEQGIIQPENKKIEIKLWGTGEVYREFLHVDDFAEICIQIFNKMDAKKLYIDLKQTHVNVGTGKDLQIKELANLIKEIVGFEGDFTWSSAKLDGTQKKCLDISLMNSIISYQSMELEDGIMKAYQNYLNS